VDDGTGRIPDVYAVAAPVLVETDHAQLTLGRFQPALQRIGDLRRLGAADDGVACVSGTVAMADVHAVEALGDAVAADGHASPRRVNARVILQQFQTRSADLEP